MKNEVEHDMKPKFVVINQSGRRRLDNEKLRLVNIHNN